MRKAGNEHVATCHFSAVVNSFELSRQLAVEHGLPVRYSWTDYLTPEERITVSNSQPAA